MTASVLQERNSRSSVSATSIALAFSSNVTAASAVHAIFAQFQGTGGVKFSAFSDNNGGSYTTLDNAYNGGSVDFETAHGYALNHAAGATTVTGTTTTSAAPLHIWIREIGGVATVSALDGHNIASSASTTNQTLSVSATNANQPAFISVLGISEWQQQACTLTGVTQDVQGASWTYAVSGHSRITAAGSNSATVNVGSANDSFQIVIAIFDEPANAAPDITPPSRPFPIIGSLFRFPALLRETQAVPAVPPLPNVLTRSGAPPLTIPRPPFLIRSPQTWPAASGPQTYTRTLNATQAQSAVLVKGASTTLATISQATIPALLKRAGKILTVAQATAASFGAFLIGIVRAITQTETLSLGKAITRALSATQATTATLRKVVSTALASISQPTIAALVKSVRTTLATVSQATAGTLSSIKVKLVTLTTITQATTATLAKSAAIVRTVSQATSLARTLAVKAIRSPTQNSIAALASGVRLARTLTQATTAAVVASRLYLRAISATQATIAALTKTPQLIRSATQATSAARALAIRATRSLTQASNPIIAKGVRLARSVAQATIAAVTLPTTAIVGAIRFTFARLARFSVAFDARFARLARRSRFTPN